MNEKLTPERIEEAKGYIKQVLELDYWIAESRKAHNIEINVGGLEERMFAYETSLAAIEAVDAMRFALDTERYKMHCDGKDKLLDYDLTFNKAIKAGEIIPQIVKVCGNSSICDDQGVFFNFFLSERYCELLTYSVGGMCGFEFETEEAATLSRREERDLAVFITTTLGALQNAGILGEEINGQETECGHCRAITDLLPTEEQAVKAWNRRAEYADE